MWCNCVLLCLLIAFALIQGTMPQHPRKELRRVSSDQLLPKRPGVPRAPCEQPETAIFGQRPPFCIRIPKYDRFLAPSGHLVAGRVGAQAHSSEGDRSRSEAEGRLAAARHRVEALLRLFSAAAQISKAPVIIMATASTPKRPKIRVLREVPVRVLEPISQSKQFLVA